MSRKLALMLACSALVSLFSFNVQALPVLSVPAQTAAPNITLVRGFCGWGFHREYGYCIRNGTVYAPPVIVTPSPPVVVAPHLCAARGGSAVCVPIRLLPWSVWPLLAVLN